MVEAEVAVDSRSWERSLGRGETECSRTAAVQEGDGADEDRPIPGAAEELAMEAVEDLEGAVGSCKDTADCVSCFV